MPSKALPDSRLHAPVHAPSGVVPVVPPILLPDPASTDGIDPATGGGGGAWISGTDLHFSASPVAGFTTTATVPGVTTDIDGDPRGSTVTKGADEFATAAVSDWALY